MLVSFILGFRIKCPQVDLSFLQETK